MNLKKCWIFAALTLLMAITVLQAQQAPVSPALPAQSAPSAAPTPAASAAPSQPVSFYRLDLAIREMDGEKLVDTRRYSLWLQSGKFERMTAGSEVPYTSATYNPSGTQTKSYRSIGVSLSATIDERDGDPWLELQANVSDVAPTDKGIQSDASTPVFRSITINAKAPLSLGKATTVGSVEDPTSKHRFQVEATATKLK
jgi:hypothetical protein